MFTSGQKNCKTSIQTQSFDIFWSYKVVIVNLYAHICPLTHPEDTGQHCYLIWVNISGHLIILSPTFPFLVSLVWSEAIPKTIVTCQMYLGCYMLHVFHQLVANIQSDLAEKNFYCCYKWGLMKGYWTIW